MNEDASSKPADAAADEELFPDERPQFSRLRWLKKKEAPPGAPAFLPASSESTPDQHADKNVGAPPEGAAAPLQLQPSTAGEAVARRRSRGRQGRSPVCSKYRMAWVLVLFDLPVGTPEERRAAGNFRKDLVKDGYIMLQFSVYARPCGSADRVETQVRRLKPKIPAKGEVRSLVISDAQWGRMIVMRSQEKVSAEPMPEQMMFF